MVGRLSTTETIVAPEIKSGKEKPTVLIKGLSATRTGYFQSSSPSVSPLARAVITYGLCNSSSRLARIIRISPAVPPSPRTSVGTQRCLVKSTTLAIARAHPRTPGKRGRRR